MSRARDLINSTTFENEIEDLPPKERCEMIIRKAEALALIEHFDKLGALESRHNDWIQEEMAYRNSNKAEAEKRHRFNLLEIKRGRV